MKCKLIETYYHAPIWLHWGTKEEFSKWIYRKFGIQTDADGSGGLFYELSAETGERVFVLWAEDGRTETMVHETVHAATAILQDRGIPIVSDGNNSETLAYLMEDIFKQWEKVINKHCNR